MTMRLRHYQGTEDYMRVSAFLIAHYQPDNADGNWLEPAWEYMHGHPALDEASLGRIGIWEEDGQIVAVAHYESSLGEAFFEFDPAYRHLQPELLDYAERHLAALPDTDGHPRTLRAYVNDNDRPFQALVSGRGYVKDPGGNRPLSQFLIPDPFPAISLPEGFGLESLADRCDWARLHRVLWRGFNHEGEPPSCEDELASRQRMFDTPRARRELKIAAATPVRPDGSGREWVSFCGTFYEPSGRFAYVEPVATDPLYRRRGLGRAAVLEGIRRCGALGATVAYVGSDQLFYQALGFRTLFNAECWVKTL